MSVEELRKALVQRAARHRQRQQAEVWAADEIDVLVRWLELPERGVVLQQDRGYRYAQLGAVARQRVEKALAEYVEELLEGLESQP